MVNSGTLRRAQSNAFTSLAYSEQRLQEHDAASRKNMDADHVTPWSVGGETTEENLVMLCGYHNKLKGNR